MASRQPGPGVEETPGFRSLPEPTAYADAVGGAQPSAESPSRHRSPEDPPPRTPSLYAQTDHFRQRLHQQGRYVSVPIVTEAIKAGQLRWNTTDGWRFALVKDGIRYVVVVSDTETRSPVVVTGWTEVADWAAASDSDRWDDTDIHTIRLRADLSAHRDEQIPDRIRPRAVDRAFEIGGHRVVTEVGAGSVECIECDGRFRSKDELNRRHCRR
ncbi:hypothetical protein [Halonotius terrestris]|uniref:hypothetical protein n=1 Tax=Halonotius terrestris TaxID=2487750 RepID=UPI001FE3A252|nr:hypothetical protein [Halonotius terrestris]